MSVSDIDFTATIEALAKSLKLVPSSTAPAIIDCVLASATGLSPSRLFYLLLDAFTKPQKNLPTEEFEVIDIENSGYVISFIAALLYIIKNFGLETDALESFICMLFVPLLKTMNENDSELLNQVVELFYDIVTRTQTWELIEATVVPYCLSSVRLSFAKLQNVEHRFYRWRLNDKISGSGLHQTAVLPMSDSLPLFIACHILSSLLSGALCAHQAEQSSVDKKVIRKHGSPGNFSKQMLWDLSNLAVCMLLQCSELRYYAIRVLLPSIFRAFDVISLFEVPLFDRASVLSREYLSIEVWNCCKSLFSLGPSERADAFLLLSLSLHSFFPIEKCKKLGLSDNAEEFDIRAEKEFWEEIRRGLVDKEGLVRKQSLHILKITLDSYSSSLRSDRIQGNTSVLKTGSDENFTPVNMTKRDKWAEEEARSLGVGEVCNSHHPCLSGQQRWEAFLLLYEMLEEYGAHLVEAAWAHQVSLLLNFSLSDSYVGNAVYQIQMETLEGIFNWLSVLWEQGICHGNPQVRCLIMQSFLATDWRNQGNCAKLVPQSFILGPFVQGLNDPVHHRFFGVKGAYSTETIEGAANFFCMLSSCFSKREKIAFVHSLASVAKQESFGRAGLMALTVCIASAAGGTKTCDEVQLCDNSCSDDKEEQATQDDLWCSNSGDLIEALQLLLERSKQHFNANYRNKVCQLVVVAATSLVSIYDMPLDVLLHFLSTLPHEFTSCGGSLSGVVENWFCSSSNACSSRIQFVKEFCDFPEVFIKHSSCNSFVFYDDEDLDRWSSEAQRWAGMISFVISEEYHFEPIYKFLQKYGAQICDQNQGVEWVPVKFLLLILSIVQEFQMQLETFINHPTEGRSEAHVDQSIFPAMFNAFEEFARHFILILEALVSFSRSACSVFWSCKMMEDAVLPGSVVGKLGGSCQRRLPSLITTSVLQAILSLKTIASISLWCTHFNRGKCVDSGIAFLWDFFLKVITSSTPMSETGAEIRVAAYEALVSILKALSGSFSPRAFELIMSYHKAMHINMVENPSLDLLLLTFLQNINDLITVGDLARSRRAILMQWKWCCLDSLLSIPHYVENGVYMGTAFPFFSHAALRNVFVDLVESLENAGENSILPMLRSVRLVLDLNFSGSKHSPVSFCEGIDTQMISQLVQSAWILHVNCNKRRVAPIAALLSSVLHSSLFNNLSMHETIGSEKGPLKWFVEKILDEGVKSPRTIRLASLHLTGLWLLYPRTIKYYINELKLLTFYGSVAFDEDFEAELAQNGDAKREFLLLSSSMEPELTQAFLNTELYARVSVAVLFHKLADAASRVQGAEKNEDTYAAVNCGQIFLLELLDLAVNNKDLAKELYKKYSKIHRLKVRAWQMICVLSPFVDKNIVEKVTSSLHTCLYKNNLPAVRQYLEAFAVQIFLKFPSMAGEQLIPIFHDYDMKSQALASYVFIATNVILHTTKSDLQLKHLDGLLPPMIPFLTCHHHSLRGFAQLLAHQVLCKLIPSVDPIGSEVMPLEKKCFQALKSYLQENPDCMRLRKSLEGILGAFDPNFSTTPAGVFSSRDEDLEFESVPTSLMEQVTTFLNDVREDLRYSMEKDIIAIKNEGLRVEETSKETTSLSKAADERPFPQIKDISFDFQKKVTLNKHEKQEIHASTCQREIKIHMPLAETEKEDHLQFSIMQSRNEAMERFRESRQQFILVASLLDRIPNLAGLARTCEVFKATGLAIADRSVLNDRQFQLISVTAEKWVPIIEVPISSIKFFLEKKKREGFSILGLEQTANSTALDQYSFPKKTVLVLGREKEGIPVDIIHVLDACVEIPQLGVVRSLNVHVSGAIALWEYTRQQRSKQ